MKIMSEIIIIDSLITKIPDLINGSYTQITFEANIDLLNKIDEAIFNNLKKLGWKEKTSIYCMKQLERDNYYVNLIYYRCFNDVSFVVSFIRKDGDNFFNHPITFQVIE